MLWNQTLTDRAEIICSLLAQYKELWRLGAGRTLLKLLTLLVADLYSPSFWGETKFQEFFVLSKKKQHVELTRVWSLTFCLSVWPFWFHLRANKVCFRFLASKLGILEWCFLQLWHQQVCRWHWVEWCSWYSKSCGDPIAGGAQEQVGWGPRQPDPMPDLMAGNPARSRVLKLDDLCDPFQPKPSHSVVL